MRTSQPIVPFCRLGIVFRVVDPLTTVFCILKLLKPLVSCNLWPLEFRWDMDNALVQSAEDFTG